MLSPETLQAFVRGEREAFVEVFRAHGTIVVAVVARFWAGAFDREEAMQEVWLHIWKNRGGVDPARCGELAGWIATVARRRCIDLLRARKSERGLVDIDETELATAPLPDPVERQQVAVAVAAFTATLSKAWRPFFDLCFVQGQSYEEIGVALGIGKLRCKYMKKVLATQARRDPALMAALARTAGGRRAP